MHKHCYDLLPFYTAGVLDDADQIVIEQHLAHCTTCQAAAREWQVIATAARCAAAVRSKRLPFLKPVVPNTQR
jgi:anti-sigma factor RsiW